MDISLLAKYLSGECTEEEKRAVKSWASENKENQDFMHMMKEIWDVEPKDEFQPRLTAGYRQVKKRVQQDQSNSATSFPDTHHGSEQKSSYRVNKTSHPDNRRAFIKPFVLTAAAGILLLITIFSLLQYLPQQSDSADSEMQKLETARGEQASFTLGDGSKVVLNADSRLKIAAGFDNGLREVYLQGEAYFEVAPDQDRPFIIYSKQTFTRVIGTKFGISAYPGDRKVQAVVEEGHVLFGIQADLGKGTESTELKANERAEVEEDGTITQHSLKSPIEQYLGWKEGKLVFDKAPLREIIPKLERWYNITLDLETTDLGERLMTATFQEQSLTEVLNIIALSLDLSYTRPNDKRVIFSDVSSTN